MVAYYNEIEPYAAQWLRNLIDAGHIANGHVDTRSIVDVKPRDLAGYSQCHFFAGIGGWSLAARLAGWPDERSLWTGSAPCQPFSVAGKGAGQADERHLWPVLAELIRARRPAVFMGEQVAAAVGKDWLDGVFADLEGFGYTCGAAVVPACAVGAPHRRDRLWFVADSQRKRRAQGGASVYPGKGDDAGSRSVRPYDDANRNESLADANRAAVRNEPGRLGGENRPGARFSGNNRQGIMADTNIVGSRQEHQDTGGRNDGSVAREVAGPDRADDGAVADANQSGESQGRQQRGGQLGGLGGDTLARDVGDSSSTGLAFRPGPTDERGTVRSEGKALAEAGYRSAWGTAAWLAGADGKARRFEPGIRLLAHGVPARVGKLRAYGNAVVPQVAAEVIAAYLETRP